MEQGNMELSQSISSFFIIAKWLLILFLILVISKSAFDIYSRIVKQEDNKPLTSITNWLRSVIFLLIAIGVLHGLQTMLREQLSGLDAVWMWAQAILFVMFFIVFVAAVIQVVNSEDGEFKGNIQRFGVGLVVLMVSFSMVSVIRLFGTSPIETIIVEKPQDQDLITLMIYAFKKSVYDSGLINAFFYATSGICAIFFTYKTIENFKNISLGKRIDIWKMAMPIVTTFIVISWKFIYMNLDKGFVLISSLFYSKLANTANMDAGFLMTLNKDLLAAIPGSLMFAGATTFVLYLIGVALSFLNLLIDCALSLYANINILLLVVFAPIALMMSYLNDMEGLKTWLKLWFKYQLLGMFPVILNFIGIMFMQNFKDVQLTSQRMAVAFLEEASGAGLILTIVTFLAFIVMKIIFIIAGRKILDALIGTQDAGIGSAVQGLGGAGVKVGKAAAGSPPV